MTKTCSIASFMTSLMMGIGALISLISVVSSSASKVMVSTVLLKSSRSIWKKGVEGKE